MENAGASRNIPLSLEVTASAERLLSQSLREATRIEWGESVSGYPHVHRGRAYVASRSEALPILLKFPQKPERWERLCNDWAGSRFLRSLPKARRFTPRSFGGDSQLRFTLSEAVEGMTFTDLLTNHSNSSAVDAPQVAATSLVEFGRTLGCLHAATYGRQGDYDQIRKCLSLGEAHVNFDLPNRIRTTLPAIQLLCRDWDVEVHDAFIDEIHAIIRFIEDPQDYLTYTHIDLNPGNLLRTDRESVCLIDFDSGAYRHALLDGVWCRLCFPGHWPACALPPELLRQVENTYRRALIPAMGVAVEDDARFSAALTDACAFWALFRLGWLAEATFEVAQNPERVAHLRRQSVVVLNRFVSTAQETGQRPTFRSMAERVLARMEEQWGDNADLIRPLPAFLTSN